MGKRRKLELMEIDGSGPSSVALAFVSECNRLCARVGSAPGGATHYRQYVRNTYANTFHRNVPDVDIDVLRFAVGYELQLRGFQEEDREDELSENFMREHAAAVSCDPSKWTRGMLDLFPLRAWAGGGASNNGTVTGKGERNMTKKSTSPSSRKVVRPGANKKKGKKKGAGKRGMIKAGTGKPKKKKKTGGNRQVGRTTGLGVQGSWVHVFVKNEKCSKAKKLTDKQITSWLNKEFPGRNSKVFAAVGQVRSKYNRGGFNQGKKPKVQSSARSDK